MTLDVQSYLIGLILSPAKTSKGRASTRKNELPFHEGKHKIKVMGYANELTVSNTKASGSTIADMVMA